MGKFKLNKSNAAKAFESSTDSTTFSIPNVLESTDDIVLISLAELYDFENHPFKVIDDDAMDELVDSIRENGVLEPGIARHRKTGSGYEIISGHRRRHACERAGLSQMPFRIIDMDDDEAVIHMTDSNIYRPQILPSEKAKAYRMKRDALAHQGKEGGKTLDELAEDSNDSARTIARYIRLSYLSDLLLDFLDKKKLKFLSGVELSYLDPESQRVVFQFMEENPKISISPNNAKEIRKMSETFGNVTDAYLIGLLMRTGKKENAKWNLKEKDIDRFFPKELSGSEKQDLILKLITKYIGDSSGESLEEKWRSLK